VGYSFLHYSPHDALPLPDEVAAEIVESLETALERFGNVAKALGETSS
jgi:type I restriction enzyme M protein